MANPRRVSYSNSNQLPISDPINPFQSQTPQTAASLLNSLKLFLKKPHAVPFLLSFFLFLTWVALRFQHYSSDSSFRQPSYDSNRVASHGGYDKYSDANTVKLPLSSSIVMKDKRGWLINPVSLALDAAISGGASFCASVHLGEIRPGGMRGNHRHHNCNETFVIWGAKTLFRLENKAVAKGYAEVTIGADEVAVAASSSGTAHALVNADAVRSTFFLGCQDSIINYSNSTSDFRVWKDL
ncbi:uncharacterized protein LOC111383754 [Olea europaea var. sylvestris]|uniref:uncharacterized protein LOC111383754 n=1 Tax=Olea europaea var. sylvestris TaxID=158386 RepID=UPI000C1CE567|nr:uncharacterized protein LOC111383754 [Olea europaea var. sylvestris]